MGCAESRVGANTTTNDDNTRPNGAESSPFFTVLPIELRRLVLVHAFGDRTVHVGRPGDCPAAFVCPLADGCYAVNPTDNHTCAYGEFREDLDRRYSLGVFGWLLACRQAYAEGVDVLYGTNTFFVTGGHLPTFLSRVLPAHRLADIKSIEWLMGSHGMTEEDQWSEFNRQPERLFDGLPEALPSLRKLYVGFGSVCFLGPPYPQTPKEYFTFFNERVLPVVDDVIREFGAGLELEVGLPTTLFHAHFQIEVEKRGRFQAPGLPLAKLTEFPLARCYPRLRVWRPVLAVSAHGTTGDSVEVGGYWISDSPVADLPWVGMAFLPHGWWREGPDTTIQYAVTSIYAQVMH